VVTNRGEGLIFLISQPRSGSTLLQRILAGHPEIHSLGEPWLMLQPLYALKREGLSAEFGAHLARQGLGHFLAALPGGEEAYLEAVRCFATHLYQRACEGSGKSCFLDKTPRYYLVLPELLRTFPEARFVFLVRNPLAVLHSVLKTWVQPDWLSLDRFAIDLMEAPRLVLDASSAGEARTALVRYEALVADPEAELARLCDALALARWPGLLEYGRHGLPRWPLGDTAVYERDRPVPERIDAWQAGLVDPQLWRLSRDYVRMLGPDLLRGLGYSAADLETTLSSTRPSRARLWATYSLDTLLARPASGSRRLRRAALELNHALLRRGVWGTTLALAGPRRKARPPV
jgi:hypothetical protein